VRANIRYEYNWDAFKAVDDEASAYWLGFLYADGSVSSGTRFFELGLAAKDVGHLIRFRDWISSNCPIRERWSPVTERHPVSYQSYRVQVYSNALVSDLISLGCIPRKTFKLVFPTKKQVPRALVRHFMRGYFDGDGSFYKNRFHVAGTFEFLDGYADQFCALGVKKNKIGRFSSTYIWCKAHRRELHLIYEFFYEGAIIFLERKKRKFELAIR